MNKHLFKYELKSNYKIILIFFILITMYVTIINSMYNPEMSSILNEMAESMPQFFALFGMVNAGSTLIEFYATYLYGFILIVIPVVLSVILCYKLIAKHVDQKTMAYFLNTGASRREIIVTQMIFLVLINILMVCYITVLMQLVSSVNFESESIWNVMIRINLYLFTLQLCLSAFTFLMATTFNDIKYSIGIPSFTILFFVLIRMLTQVSDSVEILDYINPLSLFNPTLVITQDSQYVMYSIILLLSAIVMFLASLLVFKQKDLHL